MRSSPQFSAKKLITHPDVLSDMMRLRLECTGRTTSNDKQVRQ